MDDFDVFDKITAERARQDEKYGGPDHDDTHHVGDWLRFMDTRLERVYNGGDAIKNFVEIAALAVAAIESISRVVERDVQGRDEG